LISSPPIKRFTEIRAALTGNGVAYSHRVENLSKGGTANYDNRNNFLVIHHRPISARRAVTVKDKGAAVRTAKHNSHIAEPQLLSPNRFLNKLDLKKHY
jgi:hypothetical protein